MILINQYGIVKAMVPFLDITMILLFMVTKIVSSMVLISLPVMEKMKGQKVLICINNHHSK
jgi:hypothetical protein